MQTSVLLNERKMMRLLSLVAFLGLAMNVNAATFVYVSMGPEQKIQIFRQDDAGGLTAIESVSVAGAPGSLTTDPKRRILYASLRTTSQIAASVTRAEAIPAPFDRAIIGGKDAPGRQKIQATIDSLVQQSKDLVAAANAVGITRLTLVKP